MKKERSIAVVLLLTLVLITLVILCLLLVTDRLGALGQSEEKQATMMEELAQKESQNPSEEEEPTDEELLPLFEKAMNEIISLATNPTDDVLRDIFDKEIECDYMNQIIVDDTPYQWTSRQYSELVDYYSQTFTGEALDWLLDTSFTDVDGVLYAFAGGGATGWQSKAVSVEKLDGNTYKGTYLAYHSTPEGEEESTIFSIEKPMPDTEFPTSLITLTYWREEDTEPIK